MKLSHFFLPHPETHKKAHLISIKAIAAYIIFFLLLQISFNLIPKYQSGVLGINSSVTKEQIITLTNQARQSQGLPVLVENSKLNEAAYKKAQNMFEENYWAHYSPSGKDPWGFIRGAGYNFNYAGENLAKNFYKNEDVINAWLASPTHRDNLLSSKFKEIGIAVLEGDLQGERTILVVQEFGTSYEPVAQVPTPDQQTAVITATPGETVPIDLVQNPTQVAQAPTETRVLAEGVKPSKVLIDPYATTKGIGLLLVTFLFVLIALDLYIIRRRAIYRVSARHLPHLAILTVAASTLFNMTPGSIL